MKKNVGLIGFGAVSRLYHLPYILSNYNLNLSLIVDPISINNTELHDNYNLNKSVLIIDSIDNLPPNFLIPDIFIVATPPDSHYSILLKLIDYNSVILVEKPFLLNIDQLEEIQTKVQISNSKLYVNQMRRFLPSLNFLKEAIETNRFGPLSKIRVFEGYKSSWKTVSNYNNLSQKQGGGNLIDTGIHILDSILYMTGILDFDIVNYVDNSVGDIPDSEFKLTLKSDSKDVIVDVFSTRNSNITPYYEFVFKNSILYFYLSNHNIVYTDSEKFKFSQIEVGPVFTYEDAFSSVYTEVLSENSDYFNSRISSNSNSPSIILLDKILNFDQLKSESSIQRSDSKKILIFGGNSYVSKEFIKYAIVNNFQIDVISRNPVIFNDEIFDSSIRNFAWNNAKLYTIDEFYEFSINFAYDTSLSKTKNLALISDIAQIVNKLNIRKNFHLSSISVYDSFGNVKSFNIFNINKDRYSYIKKITEVDFLKKVNNSVALRCGNFVGLDSPLWVNSFINFILERKIFPMECDHNSNIILTDDFAEFVFNFNREDVIVDVVSESITWKKYFNDLENIIGIDISYSTTKYYSNLQQNFRDLLFLFSNNPVILGYIKNSRVVEIFKNISFVKKIFLSFRKIKQQEVGKNYIDSSDVSNQILIQSRWLDSSVKNVIASQLSFESFSNSTQKNYSIFLETLKNKI